MKHILVFLFLYCFLHLRNTKINQLVLLKTKARLLTKRKAKLSGKVPVQNGLNVQLKKKLLYDIYEVKKTTATVTNIKKNNISVPEKKKKNRI
jgi:hypothetical protein